MFGHHALGVDVVNACFCHVHFVFSHGGTERVQLTVQIGQADFVIVHQVNRANAASHQGFRHKTAHAANAKDNHAALREFFHVFLAKRQLRPRKLREHSGLPFLSADYADFTDEKMPVSNRQSNRRRILRLRSGGAGGCLRPRFRASPREWHCASA